MAEPAAEPQVTLQIRLDPEAPLPQPIYANYIGVSFTPHDFTITFGWYDIPRFEVEPESGAQVPVPVQPVAKLVLPLNLLRTVSALFRRQVNAYQQVFGPLPEHPIQPAWVQEVEESEESG